MDSYEIRHRAYPLIPRKKISEYREIGSANLKTWFKDQRLVLLHIGHWLVLTLTVISLCLGCVYLHNWLPAPFEDSKDAPAFTETRARRCVEKLTEFGPRVFGSYGNEVLAKNFIIGEIEALRKERVSSVHALEVDVQQSSGCFNIALASQQINITQCYRKATNIVVRLKSESPERHALLLNCHFDSVPSSPGASDDAVSCCTMLEILRVLIRQGRTLRHDVIFLFNGAEETGLMASHGFITQHPWRHDVRAFINLEAAGAGGREILFQAGPGNPWLAKAYLASAPFPHANVFAQEIFGSGLIPSDTDFRIFRDYGRKPGLDIAYTKNGYVYHTEFDDVICRGQPGPMYHTCRLENDRNWVFE